MKNLGIIGLINFSDWDLPEFQEVGGINSVVKSIVNHLDADSIILYGFTFDKSKLLVEEKVSENITIYPMIHVPRSSRIPIRIYGFIFGWRLLKSLRRHNINVVYSHAEELAFWVQPEKVRLIHHLHTFVNVLQVSGRRISRNKAIQSLWNLLRKKVIRNSDQIVAVNEDIVEMGSRLIGSQRIVKLPNFIDYDDFRYREDSIVLRDEMKLSNFRILLYVGRISRVKGLELFIDTLQKLNGLDKDQWKGIVIGNGEYEITIREYIRGNNMESTVIFKGAINSPKMLSRYYSLANVFLITSLSESVPLTLLESLACGTPVVATNVGICKDVLGRNNGFVVSDRSPENFAKTINRAVEFKSTKSLLVDDYLYSVEHASSLLNKAFWCN